MDQHQNVHRTCAGSSRRRDALDKILPALSVVTMALTVPQVWAVWVLGNTSGVSLLSWGAYFVAACLWLMDGLRKRDKKIWVAIARGAKYASLTMVVLGTTLGMMAANIPAVLLGERLAKYRSSHQYAPHRGGPLLPPSASSFCTT
ncbi:MAG TPA: TMEM165/GDT1 family protein [Ramlibacter sp.]